LRKYFRRAVLLVPIALSRPVPVALILPVPVVLVFTILVALVLPVPVGLVKIGLVVVTPITHV
jgi:hypothetical protein